MSLAFSINNNDKTREGQFKMDLTEIFLKPVFSLSLIHTSDNRCPILRSLMISNQTLSLDSADVSEQRVLQVVFN
jgi:hypothetical protein